MNKINTCFAGAFKQCSRFMFAMVNADVKIVDSPVTSFSQ